MFEPLAVPIPEAARLTGCGRSTLYSEIAKGNLRIRKIGSRTLIAIEDLRSWLATKIVEGK
ncbi:DNA-binding protein [Aestuariivirga litoralis]|uniref:DNA-binding protein n=2 Tax=Aestuariivirga litoralis TaxID=2650924 RepID=A0A2W2ANX0_9HYPH|nr:helix-turn-helix domain-containing protein [Aestuariivirga litoralis]PZF75272.1 DNA-binding protein [Aestuariivirga litoralis]